MKESQESLRLLESQLEAKDSSIEKMISEVSDLKKLVARSKRDVEEAKNKRSNVDEELNDKEQVENKIRITIEIEFT